MTRTLVVPSPSLSPLSTDGPIPTDGQPEWSRCVMDRFRSRDPSKVLNHPHPTKFDGKYPFTVAVWQEVGCPLCYGGKVRTFECADDHEEFLGRCQDCPDSGQVGAVVATVEVTGKGHDPDAGPFPGPCIVRDITDEYVPCHPDSLPDCWHTPTGTVTRLDVPIPMERPPAKAEGHFGEIKRPAPWWWADIDLEDDRGLPDRNGGY